MQVDSLPGGRQQPFYRVLVDVRDRSPPQTTYVAQVGLNEHKHWEMTMRLCAWHCETAVHNAQSTAHRPGPRRPLSSKNSLIQLS